MTAFIKTAHCTISTLSPVHIGCGEDYYPTNYVIDDGFLHCFGEEALIAALSTAEKQRLAELAEKQGDDGIKKLQEFIHSKRNSLQAYASHSVPVSKELEKFYNSRIGQTSQHEGGGKRVNNKLEIARHAFNPYSQTLYFAGSSIKGAIRTALLNAENNGKPLPFRTNENSDVPKGSSDKLQKQLFNYQAIADDTKKGLKGDPLRLLKVSDANYQHSDGLYGSEIRFAVNRKSKLNKGIPVLMECLPAHRSRSLQFDITFLAGEKPECFENIKNLAAACNKFFLPQLENELALMAKLNYANAQWQTNLEKLLNGELGEALQQQQAFLLRVGQHGGAESNTLNGVRHIHIPQIKKYLPKPTTIWLAADSKDQQRDLLPFGWLLVEIGGTQLKQTQAFLTEWAKADAARQEKWQQLTTQRAEFFAKEQAKREKLAAQHAEIEKQERERQAQQAAIAATKANMSAAQQVVFDLQQQYALAKTKTPEPNGALREQLTKIIKQASDWTHDDKQALLAIGNELCSFWGKPKKLKDQLKVLQ